MLNDEYNFTFLGKENGLAKGEIFKDFDLLQPYINR